MRLIDVLTRADLPLVPDGEEGRRQAEEELSKSEYDAAEPTLIDRVARAVTDFIGSLFSGEGPEGIGPLILVIIALIAIALIVIAFVVWGRPRAIHRAAAGYAPLFGDDDARSAAELRADAHTHATAGEWDAAIILRTRALARGLLERGIVDPPPGATVHAFARASTRAYPDLASVLDGIADAFDDVRYLRRVGTREAYDRVALLDDTIARTPAERSVFASTAPGAPA